MKKQRQICIFLIAAILLALLAGCTQSNGGQTSDNTNNPGQPSGDTANPGQSSNPGTSDTSQPGAPDPSGGITSTKDTLTIGNTDFLTFNFFNSTQVRDMNLNGYVIGEGLISVNNDFSYEPRICEKYDVSSDYLVYTFHVRPNVVFHNGQAVTADDVAYSLEYAKNSIIGEPLQAAIKTIEKTDNMTVVVTLNEASFGFLFNIANYCVVVPNGIFESGYDFESHPIGAGPYEFVSYQPGDKLVLKVFDGYYSDSLPRIKNVVYKIIPDATTGCIALETGQIDFIITDATNYLLLQGNPDVELFTYPVGNSFMLFFNNEMAPFDDVNVRLALNYAIDRSAFCKVLGEAGFTPATSNTTPSMYGYNEMPGYPFNADLARSYLAKSKYSTDELAFSLITIDRFSTQAAFLQESFRNIGINVSIDIIDPNSFMQGIMEKSISNALITFGVGAMATSNTLHFTSDGPFTQGYSNPEVDRLLEWLLPLWMRMSGLPH